MIPQPQNLDQHIQKRWNFEKIEVIPTLQEKEYEFQYDHEKFTDYELIQPNNNQYLSNLLKFESSKEHLRAIHNTQGYISSFYLNEKLDNCKNYIIDISLDRKKDSYFYFGIISKEQLGTVGVEIKYGDVGGGSTNQIKGKVHTGYTDGDLEGRRLELKINISKGYWVIATIPDYSNISELDSSIKIDSSKNYYFAFSLERSVNLCINGIYEVSEFHHHD